MVKDHLQPITSSTIRLIVNGFSDSEGNPNADYLTAVRARFGQWIRDTCAARYARAWLDYQQEIALRHTRAKKNQTDGVRSAAEHIALRYMIAFIYPITATIKPFLAKKGHSQDEVEKMHQALVQSRGFARHALELTLHQAR